MSLLKCATCDHKKIDLVGDDMRRGFGRTGRLRLIREITQVAPLRLFLVLTFAWPIVSFAYRSVDNTILHQTFPCTHAALESWVPPAALPPEA
jgi:hypothetical protein